MKCYARRACSLGQRIALGRSEQSERRVGAESDHEAKPNGIF